MLPTLKGPYVLVQRRGGNGKEQRIPLETTLNSLKEQCTRALNYKDNAKVVALYNEADQIIRDIREIQSGMLIYASTVNIGQNESYTQSLKIEKISKTDNPKQKIPSGSGKESDDLDVGDGFGEILDSDSFDENASMDGQQHKKEFRFVSLEREKIIINSIYNQYRDYIGEPSGDPTEFTEFVSGIIQSGFYSAPGSYYPTSTFRTILVGPPQSGKTTMLKMVSNQIYQNLITAGLSREVFMFYIDFREIKDECSSIPSFYRAFVERLIDQIDIQYPLLKVEPPKDDKNRIPKRSTTSNSLNLVKDFLNQFAEFSGNLEPVSTKFPHVEPLQSIAQALNFLGKQLAEAAQNRTTRIPFLTEIATLPSLVSKIFNFKRIHYVFDHVDESDINIDSGLGHFALSTYVKMMLSLGSFTISCSDEERINDVCEPIDDEDVDLKTSSNFVSVLDSFDRPPDSTFCFELTYDNVPKPIIFQIEDCGGCGGYIAKWRKIEEHAEPLLKNIRSPSKVKKEIDNRKEIEEEKMLEKARLKVLLLLKKLVPLLLSDQDQKTMIPSDISGNLESFVIVEKEKLNKKANKQVNKSNKQPNKQAK